MKLLFRLLMNLLFCGGAFLEAENLQFQLPLIRIVKNWSTQIEVHFDSSTQSLINFFKLSQQVSPVFGQTFQYSGPNNHILFSLADFTLTSQVEFKEGCKIPLYFLKTDWNTDPTLIQINDDQLIINADYFGYSRINQLSTSSEFLLQDVLNSTFLADMSLQRIELSPFDVLS